MAIKSCTPTKEEISSAIEQLKNGKSTEPDIIQAERLKAFVETSVQLLYPLFRKISEVDKMSNREQRGISHQAPRER
ncbi:hypothetical protein DPMN_030182 [Dreissena polymorpha]|uniref:Uncharacterized protein n=1 Tax=Dreissena polymorpha TaxID=45954 RepID=A0A9D4M0M4_DREPO|nr:hypothetical protein DPMN_030182 [Dreissena polymorpha]